MLFLFMALSDLYQAVGHGTVRRRSGTSIPELSACMLNVPWNRHFFSSNPSSGRFSYDSRKHMFIVHNLYDGFDAYKIKGSTVEHFRSYQSAAPKERNVPLSCIFIEGGKSVALGTITGKVMILDTEKVSTKQILQHCGTQSAQGILCIVLTEVYRGGRPRSRNSTLSTNCSSSYPRRLKHNP